MFPQPTGAVLIDMGDLVFYEAAMEKWSDDICLVTRNQKQYPFRDFMLLQRKWQQIIEVTEKIDLRNF